MAEQTPPDPAPRMGGGAPIALLTIVGAIVGGLWRQPVVGMLAGLGLGAAIALLIWRMGPR